jgi:hypothetical protein
MHAYERQACTIHAHETHAYEVYPYEIHTREMHICETPTHEMHTREMHTHEMHTREIYAHRSMAFWGYGGAGVVKGVFLDLLVKGPSYGQKRGYQVSVSEDLLARVIYQP